MKTEQTHKCPDGTVNTWFSRVPKPKCCPRCKAYLNKGKDKGK